MRLVIEMMGGDHGVKATIPAVINFHKDYPDVELFAVGKIEVLQELEGIATLIDARDEVAVDATPLEVLRARESSLLKAINAVLDEKADAIVSAGGTGPFLSAATLKLKLVEGVERAAILAPFPTKIKGKQVAILDIGASNENTAKHLYQFALMGQFYAKAALNVENPRTYLLSNGTEDSKGIPVVVEANKLIREKNVPNFLGNIEAREVMSGDADVVVADGYTGNILLKSIEGTAKTLSGGIKKAFKRNLFSKIGYIFARKGFNEMTETFDYKNTGGAILIGVNNVVVKAHGNSDPRGFYSALVVAYKMAKADIVNEVRKGMQDVEA
ncbi:MAG: phosphate acyltransferase PlsX [Bacilli bacterium]|nr:phosphate acyltransferase PlsX [Bacilli bacterium]